MVARAEARYALTADDRASATLRRFRNNVSDADRSMARFTRTLRGAGIVGLGILGANLVRQADAYGQLQQRIRVATTASRDFAEVNQRLFSISQRTGAALTATTDTFQRLARSAPALGATNDQVLQVVENIQKLAAVSGTGTEQLSAGLLQFSQLLAQSRPQAEELNSILENLPAVATEIEKGLGLLPGQLKAAAREGRVLSADIFRALLERTQQVDEQFRALGDSVGRAGQRRERRK